MSAAVRQKDMVEEETLQHFRSLAGAQHNLDLLRLGQDQEFGVPFREMHMRTMKWNVSHVVVDSMTTVGFALPGSRLCARAAIEDTNPDESWGAIPAAASDSPDLPEHIIPVTSGSLMTDATAETTHLSILFDPQRKAFHLLPVHSQGVAPSFALERKPFAARCVCLYRCPRTCLPASPDGVYPLLQAETTACKLL